ncbi:EamA family transporter [Chloroflexota bacterium]
MFWITTAIIATAIMAVVSIVDSHLISKRMPSLRSFLLPLGILHLGFCLVTLGLNPLPEEIGATPLLTAFTSGIMRSAGALLMLKTMRSEEVSRIISVIHTFPIFVAIMAVPLLGEVLGYTEWLAIFMTVAGAILISLHRDANGRGPRLRKSFAMLTASSMLMGIANIAAKYSLDYISFWNMYSVNALCLAIVFLLFSLRPWVVKELLKMKQRGQALTLLLLNESIAVVGILLSFLAIERGPVSLVSTIMSIRPGFVFIYTLVLGLISPRVLEEHLSRGIIAIKVISIGLITSGVILLIQGP